MSGRTGRVVRLSLSFVVGSVAVVAVTIVMLIVPALVQGWQARQHLIVSPTHVVGLRGDDDPGAHDTVLRLRHALERSLGLSTTGAAYTDDGSGPHRRRPGRCRGSRW